MARLTKTLMFLGLVLFASLACATDTHATAKTGPTPAEKRLMASGVRIVTRFDSVSGLRAIVADNGKERRLFYVTPDGKSLIAGLVFDQNGLNVTNLDMSRAGITGGNRTTTLTQLEAQEVWKKVQTLRALKDGDRGHLVYAFFDPQCDFCHLFMSKIRPYITAGRVQMRWLPVTILSETSKGLAEGMYRMPSGTQAIEALENSTLMASPQTPDVRLDLAKNLLAMRDTGSTGVPVLVYRVGTRVVVSTGVPSDAEMSVIVSGQ